MEETMSLTQSKNQIAQFVSDMVDIETREFTLRQTAQELNNQADEIKFKAERSAKNAQNSYNETSKKLAETQRTLTKLESYGFQEEPAAPIEPQKPDCLEEYKILPPDKPYFSIWDDIIRFPLIALCLCIWPITPIFFAIVIAIFGFTGIAELNDTFLWIAGSICTVIVAIVYIIISVIHIRSNISNYFMRKKKNERYLELSSIINEYNTALNTYKSQVRKYEEIQRFNGNRRLEIAKLKRQLEAQTARTNEAYINMQQATDQVAVANRKYDLLLDQSNMMIEQADKINIKKNEIYNIGIVPPDYRTMDCIIMINSIFKNDQADTMREATLLYDTKVYRGEVIKGIHNIYQMLGNLAHSMQAIGQTLNIIKENVSTMKLELNTVSNQLCGIQDTMEQNSKQLSESLHAENQKQQEILNSINEERTWDSRIQAQYQEELLKETRAARYAFESYNISNQKYDWYIDQHRQGLL